MTSYQQLVSHVEQWAADLRCQVNYVPQPILALYGYCPLRIEIPKIRGILSYTIAMHELGHVATLPEPPVYGEAYQVFVHGYHNNEAVAWTWAQDHALPGCFHRSTWRYAYLRNRRRIMRELMR